MSYKYPFIPKEYYRAVMFACKLIREHKTFNKACQTAADYYGVDENEVRNHVSARAAAGHKGKKQGKQSWFVVTCYHGSDASGYEKEECKVVRGKSRANVESRFLKESGEYNRRHDRNGSSYSWAQFFNIDGPYETKAEAQAECDRQNAEIQERRKREDELYESRQNQSTVRQQPTTVNMSTDIAALFGLLQNADGAFAQHMLDRRYPGWRDTDLSIEQVYPLRVW